MTTHPAHAFTRAARLAVGATTVALLLATHPTSAVSDAREASQQVTTTRLTPVPISAAEIPNPLRGQYRWMGARSQPKGWPGGDVYYRDQVYWGRLEPTDNKFDFSAIDVGLAEAAERGGKFNFRVMAYCPGCWMNTRDGWPAVAPRFLPRKRGTDVPRWNHPTFIAQWKELMAELGRRYGHDERIGIVDVGGYGKYGEYWTDRSEGRISRANSQRLIRAVVKAFPRAHVVLNTMDPSLVLPAVRKFKRLGLRTDCLGAHNMHSLIPTSPELQRVWKRAPVISEWCHQPTATAAEGLKQVRQYHVSMVSSGNQWTPYTRMSGSEQRAWTTAAKTAGYRYAITSVRTPAVWQRGTEAAVTVRLRNDGSAPTYDRWEPRIGLRDDTGAVVWQAPWDVGLHRLLPGKHRIAAEVAVPATAPTGTFTLVAQVASTSELYAPMNLANTDRDSDGWYPLTTVTVGE